MVKRALLVFLHSNSLFADLVRQGDNMTSSDEKGNLAAAAAAFSHAKATGTRSKRCSLDKDVETEGVSKRVANVCSWVRGEDGREELGTGRPDD
jgi:hypothetical protein